MMQPLEKLAGIETGLDLTSPISALEEDEYKLLAMDTEDGCRMDSLRCSSILAPDEEVILSSDGDRTSLERCVEAEVNVAVTSHEVVTD